MLLDLPVKLRPSLIQQLGFVGFFSSPRVFVPRATSPRSVLSWSAPLFPSVTLFLLPFVFANKLRKQLNLSSSMKTVEN